MTDPIGRTGRAPGGSFDETTDEPDETKLSRNDLDTGIDNLRYRLMRPFDYELRSTDVARLARLESEAMKRNHVERTAAGHEPRDSDYVTVTVGVGAVIGVSVSGSVDRYGNFYVGLGGGVGLSPWLVSGSIVSGRLIGDKPSASDIEGFLTGDAVSAGGGAGPSAGVVNSAGGTAIEQGLATPQVGAQFEHTWRLE